MNKLRISLLAIVLALAYTPAGAAQVCNNFVQESTPTARFNDNGDGTVSDTQTQLMWAKCAEGTNINICTGTALELEWKGALLRADGSKLAFYEDWRLPNVKELASIVELACNNPAINLSLFPNTTAGFWSATPYANNHAWRINFNGGLNGISARNANRRVRLVRDE